MKPYVLHVWGSGACVYLCASKRGRNYSLTFPEPQLHLKNPICIMVRANSEWSVEVRGCLCISIQHGAVVPWGPTRWWMKGLRTWIPFHITFLIALFFFLLKVLIFFICVFPPYTFRGIQPLLGLDLLLEVAQFIHHDLVHLRKINSHVLQGDPAPSMLLNQLSCHFICIIRPSGRAAVKLVVSYS